MISGKVRQGEDEEAENDGGADSALGDSVDLRHLVLEGDDGVVRQAHQELRKTHQGDDYPSVSFFLALWEDGLGKLWLCRCVGLGKRVFFKLHFPGLYR